MNKRLAIITTHPIQYYAPVFRLLHERKKIDIMIFYTWGEQSQQKFDPGFNKTIQWDIPLLDGYPFTWVKNTSPDPGTHHRKGIINPGLVEDIKNWKADAILVFGWAWQSHLSAMRHFKGKIPVYFRGDSTLLQDSSPLKKITRFLWLKWVYRHVDTAFYVGTNNKAYYLNYGLRENQLVFAPHAADNERFKPVHAADAGEFRTRLGLGASDVLVLYAGKFEPVKNLALLISAFLETPGRQAHLLLVGNGLLEQQLKTLAGDDARIHFMDFQNQSAMPVIYQACDLFCLPSVSETWGMAVAEAMASGKAVLVSDKVGCAIDLVKNEQNGDIFESGNQSDLAKKLGELTASSEKLKKMGRRSSGIIQNWSFAEIVKVIEKKLNEKN